jgi:hypothetical protein
MVANNLIDILQVSQCDKGDRFSGEQFTGMFGDN